MRAVIYSRVSTDAQERDGTSLDTQERACIEYAQAKGWVLVETARDTASGSNLDRPGMERVRELLNRGLVDVVLAYAVDRLSRSQIHIAVLLDNIERADATLELVTEDFENSSVGRLILTVRAFSGEVEREKIAERTMRGKAERARAGKLPQGTGQGIYGYIYNREKGVREINPVQAEVVKHIFHDFVATYSCHRIAVELNRASIPAYAGGKWHPLTVRRMLQNETYSGRTVYRKTKAEKVFDHRTGKKVRQVTAREEKDWIEIPDATPAIISTEVYERAQTVLNSPSRRNRKPNGRYRLTGHLNCIYCSTPMVGHAQAKGQYRYYRCRKTYSGDTEGKCQSRYVRQDALEESVLGEISSLMSDPERIVNEIRAFNSDKSGSHQKMNLVNSELELMGEKESRLAHLYIEGSISEKVLDQEKETLMKRKTVLAKEKYALERESDHTFDMDDAALKLPQISARIGRWIQEAKGENMEMLLNALDINIKASKDKVQISGSVPDLPETGTNFVTIVQTSASLFSPV